MIIKQYYLGCLSHASYMVADEATRSAVVVDPRRDVDCYIQDAQAQGLQIKDVVLTHFHADFVAGHLELQKRTGAPISLGAAAHPGYAFTPRQEGDRLQYGNTVLQVMETPGHTPESISLLAFDTAKDKDHPQAVLTGDTLFVGDVGRPDLMASQGTSAEQLAGQLYDSLHNKLLALPDQTVVYPAHGPGSLCGSGHTSDTVSTIGVERESNFALQPMEKPAFVHLITSNLPDLPPYFARDAAINKAEHEPLEGVLEREVKGLAAGDVLRMQSEGAQVLDVRSPDDFAAGHIRNSVNIGLDGRFASWAAILLDANKPIVVLTPPGRENETAMRLGRVGLDNVAGYVAQGMDAFRDQPDQVTSTARVTPTELAAQLASSSPPLVVDVRAASEYREAHIAGSTNIPLSQLRQRQDEVPRDRPVVVHCQSGYRSSMAVSLLAQRGGCYSDLMGGIAAWQAAGLPTVSGSAAG